MGLRDGLASVSNSCSWATSFARQEFKAWWPSSQISTGRLAAIEAALVAAGTYFAWQSWSGAGCVLRGAALGVFAHSLGISSSSATNEKEKRENLIGKISLAPVGALLNRHAMETSLPGASWVPGLAFGFRAVEIADQSLSGLVQQPPPTAKVAAMNEKLAVARDVILVLAGALAYYQTNPDQVVWGLGAAAATTFLNQVLHPAPKPKENPNRLEILGTIVFAAMGAAATRYRIFGRTAGGDVANYFFPHAVGVGAYAGFNNLLHRFAR